MKRQTFTLPNYDWRVTVFYDTKTHDVDYVIDALDEIGCTEENLRRSYRNIVSGDANNGLTFSNLGQRESVVSIGHADSLGEFLDTFQHEITHLCRHVCQYHHIDPWGEAAAYLAGDIAKRMHPLLEPYMCSCKKCKCHG